MAARPKAKQIAVPEFPVRVVGTLDGRKVTRTAHSIIALRQLETEGFTLEPVRKSSEQSDSQSDVSDNKSPKSTT